MTTLWYAVCIGVWLCCCLFSHSIAINSLSPFSVLPKEICNSRYISHWIEWKEDNENREKKCRNKKKHTLQQTTLDKVLVQTVFGRRISYACACGAISMRLELMFNRRGWFFVYPSLSLHFSFQIWSDCIL